jgi:hypothetical protein
LLATRKVAITLSGVMRSAISIGDLDLRPECA